MKKSVAILLEMGYWVTYLFILFTIVAAATQGFSQGPAAKQIIRFGFGLCIVPAIISFYGIPLLNLLDYWSQKKYKQFFGRATGLLLVAALISYLVILSFIRHFHSFNVFLEIYICLVLIALFHLFLGMLLKGFIRWNNDLKEKEQLKQQQLKLELELLKSKLDPHFLFNTLQNIDVLIHKSPEKASSFLNKLSGMLRFMLFEADQNYISLDKEVNYIQDYIELQRIRTTNDSYVNFEVKGMLDDFKIPPMLFIPLIENAFKYCSNKKTEDAIQIKLNQKGTALDFEISNYFDQQLILDKQTSKQGMKLIQERLHLLYPNQFKLNQKVEGNRYIVHLNIQPHAA
jgi:two-component system LytT family sensor kinase